MDDAPTVIRVFIDSTSENQSKLEKEILDDFFQFERDFNNEGKKEDFSCSYCSSGPSQPYVSLRSTHPNFLQAYVAWARITFPTYKFELEKD